MKKTTAILGAIALAASPAAFANILQVDVTGVFNNIAGSTTTIYGQSVANGSAFDATYYFNSSLINSGSSPSSLGAYIDSTTPALYSPTLSIDGVSVNIPGGFRANSYLAFQEIDLGQNTGGNVTAALDYSVAQFPDTSWSTLTNCLFNFSADNASGNLYVAANNLAGQVVGAVNTVTIQPVPEPSVLALGTIAAAFVLRGLRRKSPVASSGIQG